MSFHIGYVHVSLYCITNHGSQPMSFHIGYVLYFFNLPIIIDIGFVGTPQTYNVLQIRII